jgi:hypothetical protein
MGAAMCKAACSAVAMDAAAGAANGFGGESCTGCGSGCGYWVQ